MSEDEKTWSYGFFQAFCAIANIVCMGFLMTYFFPGKIVQKIENQAIQKGYAEIRVINGERKFQWKDSAITE